MKHVKIKILRGTQVGSRPLKVGQVVKLPEQDALLLVSYGKAELHVAAPEPEDVGPVDDGDELDGLLDDDDESPADEPAPKKRGRSRPRRSG